MQLAKINKSAKRHQASADMTEKSKISAAWQPAKKTREKAAAKPKIAGEKRGMRK